jgi:hypothetical protein
MCPVCFVNYVTSLYHGNSLSPRERARVRAPDRQILSANGRGLR